MIIAHQHAAEETRTGSGCKWLAEARVDGVLYLAQSRHGAAHALARRLVEAGIGDAPLRLFTDGLAGYSTWRSFHEMAGYTYAEGDRQPLRRVRYQRREDGVRAAAEGQKQGVKPPEATFARPAASGAARAPSALVAADAA
jgi:hypothetical protein